MWKFFNKLETHHQIIWATIIATAIISYWRGIWGLMDEYLYPDASHISYLVSFILGFVILAMTHYLSKEFLDNDDGSVTRTLNDISKWMEQLGTTPEKQKVVRKTAK